MWRFKSVRDYSEGIKLRSIIAIIFVVSLLIGFPIIATGEKKSNGNNKNGELTIMPIVVSELNELDEFTFSQEYSKLDEYMELEVGDVDLFKYSGFTDDYPLDSKLTNKKFLANRLGLVVGYCFENTIYNRCERRKEKIHLSLRGLRFLPNLKSIRMRDCHIYDLDELRFISDSILTIRFDNCSFNESIDDFGSYIAESNIYAIGLTNCNLTNINFLRGLKSLDGMCLELGGNLIEDIEILNDFKGARLEWLSLNDNRISNIDPLLNLSFSTLDLSGNKLSDVKLISKFNVEWLCLNNNQIADINPLGNMAVGVMIEFADNCILDYSSVKKHIDYYFNNGYVDLPNKYKSKVFRIDKHGNFNLHVNGKSVDEKAFGKTTYFNEAKYLDELSALEELEPACSIIALVAAFGGTTEYNKDLSILTCWLDGKKFEFSDFSEYVAINGEVKEMRFAMKRMQGDIPFCTLSDMQEIFDFKVEIQETRKFYILIDGYIEEEYLASKVNIIR